MTGSENKKINQLGEVDKKTGVRSGVWGGIVGRDDWY